MEAFKVITDPGGTTVHSYVKGGKPDENPLDIEAAQRLADEANRRAEKLGLAVRYTVVPR